MKKKFLIGLLAVVMCFALTGCGEEKTSSGNNGETNTNGEYQGDTKGDSDLKNVTNSNYKNVAKNVFGITVSDNTGWILKSASSPNKVNNLVIEYTIQDGNDAKAILEDYFNKCSSVSNDGIYSTEYDGNYSIVKKEKYDDFATYFENDGTNMDPLFQSMWIYDNNGKSIQLTISINATKASITFGLLG